MFPLLSSAGRSASGRFSCFLLLLMGACTLFLTEEALRETLGHRRVRRQGQTLEVTVTGLSRKPAGRGSFRNRTQTYRYQARFLYKNRPQTVRITEDDFRRLKPADRVKVLYDPAEEAFLPTDARPEPRLMLLPVAGWLLLFGLLRLGFCRYC
ncbi:DUF3592 domain-containing protein [Larkinella soli]|uniref:DUF3592 domain-containing protein n=1 Tax=Larkinella soli TaxID=1770527 RepID=UPI000FFC4758|nr:DUF3592 domain-containing protein [Larkinella soli]